MNVKLTEEQMVVLRRVMEEGNAGFLTQKDVACLADTDLRLVSCVVRCGAMRALVPLQDVSRFCQIIANETVIDEYVRDVSIAPGEILRLKKAMQNYKTVAKYVAAQGV